MKTLLSIKVQVVAGLNFSEMSFIVKTYCCLVIAILAYQVGLLIYTLVKRKK